MLLDGSRCASAFLQLCSGSLRTPQVWRLGLRRNCQRLVQSSLALAGAGLCVAARGISVQVQRYTHFLRHVWNA